MLLLFYSITSKHNNEVVQKIIADIGTEEFAKDLIRSKFISVNFVHCFIAMLFNRRL